jgi:hypothetical protein
MSALRGALVTQRLLPGSVLQDVFPHLMGTDIGRIDTARRVSRKETQPESTTSSFGGV